ncbi:MAG TPA: hypothetical protein VNA04_02750 [Thermoanaerobaculia bacterium]|nr:hypothetical protein [Thermoanaerobaculia bacterium]
MHELDQIHGAVGAVGDRWMTLPPLSMRTVAVVLAAGGSSRFGRPKQLLDLLDGPEADRDRRRSAR